MIYVWCIYSPPWDVSVMGTSYGGHHGPSVNFASHPTPTPEEAMYLIWKSLFSTNFTWADGDLSSINQTTRNIFQGISFSKLDNFI